MLIFNIAEIFFTNLGKLRKMINMYIIVPDIKYTLHSKRCPRKNFLIGFGGITLPAKFLRHLFTHRKVFEFKIKVSLLYLPCIQKFGCR